MKRKRQSNFLVFSFLAFFIVSCTKYNDYPTAPSKSTDPVANFDAFWVGINDNYAFFAYSDLNWDDVYNEFRPRVSSSTTDQELLDIFDEIRSRLIDGHCLILANGVSYGRLNLNYFAKYTEIKTDSIILKYYLDNVYRDFKYQENDKVEVESYLSQFKNHSGIAYIRYYKFQNALSDTKQDSTFNVLLKTIQEQSYKGLILDLRNNYGGLATSFKTLISKFIPNQSYVWGYSKFRISRDRYEMTPFIDEKVNFNGLVNVTKPIVIITNRYTFSAAELTALALKNLPNVTIIGDTTGGAQGPIFSAESQNGGTDKDFTGNFKLPNGWIVQLAQKASFDNERKIYEGRGLPPDLVVKQSLEDYFNNIDNTLDAAIQYLDK